MKSLKKNRRAAKRYPALDPKLNLKSRQDLIDYDYVNKLNDKEKDFLNKFSEEFINASFSAKGKPLHRTKKMRKDCYDRNNARNRDILTKAKIMDKVDRYDAIEHTSSLEVFDEDSMIEIIDKKKLLD